MAMVFLIMLTSARIFPARLNIKAVPYLIQIKTVSTMKKINVLL
jgi:hypothetical protein